MDEAIQKVVASHFDYSPYTREKIKDLELKPILHNIDVGDDFVTVESNAKYVLWSHLATLLAPLVRPLLVFSSSIPSFFDLTWDDRLLCLKLRFFEIWLIHASCLVNCDHGTIAFGNGCYISRHQLKIIYDENFVAQLFNFSGCLKDLQLSDSAVALYSAVVLYSTDARESTQPALLQKLQEKYKIYLSYQLHVLDRRPEVFEILLSVLPELQDIGRRHLQHVKTISTEILPSAREPLLLTEVFDLAKEEDVKELLSNEK